MRGKTSLDAHGLAKSIRAGDRRALARAITLVESTRADHRAAARQLLEALAEVQRDVRIGITGVPGVGKSTFIEAFGMYVADAGHRIAVLSVDPSSAVSGGSILADKTRMPELARHERAFSRPSPAGKTLGGVARHTHEAVMLCEAAGFDVVLVETVGVGQSETAVADLTDVFVLMLLPVAGDELQGMKRGIVELADLILVNKADGELMAAATRTAAQYTNALRMVRGRSSSWTVPVETCSALSGDGVTEVWEIIERYRGAMGEAGELQARRAGQATKQFWAEASTSLVAMLKSDANIAARCAAIEQAVASGRLPPRVAARRLVETLLNRKGKCGS